MNSTDVQNSTSPAIVGNNVLCPVVLDVLYEWHRKQSGWRYGLVRADHYRPIEEQNLIQPLLTIPLVSVSFLSVGGAKLK